MRLVAPLLALGLAVAAAGCGNQPAIVAGQDDGRVGDAADVVRCVTPGSEGGQRGAVHSEGATAGTAEGALEVARGEGGFDGVQTGLREARRDADRVLYVVEVGGAVKQAVVVRDGPATRGAGGPGWYVESWAVCDAAELPRRYTDSIGLQVWTDASGLPVPVATLRVQTGPDHCDWQSMTFLELDGVTYVRDPLPDLGDFVLGAFREHVAVPDDAVPTGYHRDGDRLWTSPDRLHVLVGSPDDAEAWPRASDDLACA